MGEAILPRRAEKPSSTIFPSGYWNEWKIRVALLGVGLLPTFGPVTAVPEKLCSFVIWRQQGPLVLHGIWTMMLAETMADRNSTTPGCRVYICIVRCT